MYAIVEIGGMQYKVAQAATVCVPKMEQEPGIKVNFDRVLMIVDGENVKVGTPVVANAVVNATVVSHFKDDKVIIFKKKRRKTYQVMRGHRQQLTEIKIDTISVGSVKAGSEESAEESRPKTAAAKKAGSTAAAAAKKTTTKPKAAAEKKPVAAKKSAAPAKARKAPSKPSEKKEA